MKSERVRPRAPEGSLTLDAGGGGCETSDPFAEGAGEEGQGVRHLPGKLPTPPCSPALHVVPQESPGSLLSTARCGPPNPKLKPPKLNSWKTGARRSLRGYSARLLCEISELGPRED